MTFQKNAFVKLLIFTIAFAEVAAWTIDLPEVRKFLFEKTETYGKNSKNEYDDYLTKDRRFYSNIAGNSKHNSKEYQHHGYEKEKYADEYGYQSYMEKKVQNIVRDGSKYLEGLRRSLEDYSEYLEECRRQKSNAVLQNTTSSNITSWRPQYDSPSPNSANFNSTDSATQYLNFQNYETDKVPMRPSSGPRGPNVRRPKITCEEATEASEQVRRYADLAMWATMRLQDLGYAKKYQKTDEQEENELILKLAWFLDRLAFLTGYEPEYKEYEPTGTRTSTIAPTAPTLVPSSDELNREMMDCLRQNSSEPATVRCRYPLELPDLMKRVYGDSGTTPSSPTNSNSVVPMNRPTDSISEQSSEILVTADNTPQFSQKSPISKRSTEYTYYYPSKPLHEVAYPIPIVKLLKHKLSNIKSVVKTIVEKRLQHLAEKKEEKSHLEHHHLEHHFDKRSLDDNTEQTSNSIKSIADQKSIAKSVEKVTLNDIETPLGLLHYPVSDVSVINTKSFRKRSIDERRITSNHLSRLSNLKSVIKSVEKGPLIRKIFDHFVSATNKVKLFAQKPLTDIKSIRKRNAEDPLSKLTNYYIKYKVWDNSNPIKKIYMKKPMNFDVKNHLNDPKSIQKRSLFNKKVIHMHIPKPLQIVRTYVHTHKEHDNHKLHKPTLLSHLSKLHDLKRKKLDKVHKNIKKRSLKYEYMYLPRIPMNPQGDISYYIKNKEGTNYNPSLLQAGQVRLGLEQVGQTGNIEVVRRYGANYNPLNPAPFYTGILASMADS